MALSVLGHAHTGVFCTVHMAQDHENGRMRSSTPKRQHGVAESFAYHSSVCPVPQFPQDFHAMIFLFCQVSTWKLEPKRPFGLQGADRLKQYIRTLLLFQFCYTDMP